MRKILILMLGIVFAIAMLAGCAAPAAEQPAASEPVAEEPQADVNPGDITFGNLAWSTADEWNAYGIEAWEWKAEQVGGVNTEVLDCQKDPETQISQATDFINKGVDGISIFPAHPMLLLLLPVCVMKPAYLSP
ncbi:MAG: hypothetical protein U5N58_13825 [Actinomycetota bacterium]|nr:hypothetical protein [Actinomycetota bacterium]